MLSEESYSIKIKHKEGIFPKNNDPYDLYLSQLGDLFFDHQRHLERLASKLEDFDAKACRGQSVDVDLIGSKAIITDQSDPEQPEEHPIEIDRVSLLEIVTAYNQLLEDKATEITLFRDDQNMTIVGTFEDKPEFRKTVAYRCKGNAFNEVKIAAYKETYKIIAATGSDYLRQLAKFLIDYLSNLDNLVQLLDNPETEEITQGNMHAICKKTKVIIIDMRDEFPYDNETAIDRAHFITLIKAWQDLLAKKPPLITLQKNDDYITLIGSFGKDKPEYKETFAYRIRY